MVSSSPSTPPAPDRGQAVFTVTTTTFVLATIFVVARLVSRLGILRRIHLEDIVIVVAWLLALGLSFNIDLATKFGLGKHDINISEQDKVSLKKCEYVFSILYNPSLMVTKASILIFYLRISKESRKVLHFASWVVLVIVTLATLTLVPMNIFQCQPVNAAFESIDGKCFSQRTRFLCASPVNVATNLAVLALPIPVLTSLRLPRRQKVIIILTFGLGIFVTVVDVVRIYYFQQAIISFSSPNSSFASPNYAWYVSFAFMWSAVEINVGITCACIPFLKPLVMRFLPSMLFTPEGTPITSDSQGTCVMSNPLQYQNDQRAEAENNEAHDTNRAEASMMASTTLPDWPGPPSRNHSNSDHRRGYALDSTAMDPQANDIVQARNQLGRHYSTHHSSATQENSFFFGFMHIKETKNMLEASVLESLKYCIVITTILFLWGIADGIITAFNGAIAGIAQMSLAKYLGIEAMYYSGFFFGPLLGRWVLRYDEQPKSLRGHSSSRHDGSVKGFKATIIVGLCIYGIGAIMSWPCAVLASFAGLMISSLVIGFASGVLFTGAFTFVALCGPSEYSELRLCIAWGFRLVGDNLGLLLADNVLLANLLTRIQNDHNNYSPVVLLNIQWTYLSVTLFDAGLALVFFYVPLPEVSDSELEKATASLAVDTRKRSICGLRLPTVCLILAVVTQSTCHASMGILNEFFDTLLIAFARPSTLPSALRPSLLGKASWLAISLPHYFIISRTAAATARFAAGFVSYLHVKRPQCRFIPAPRTVLLLSMAGCLLCTIIIVALRPARNPNLSVIRVILFYFFLGPLVPLIFAAGLRGQGKRTKSAGAYLTMCISSSSIFSWAAYAITEGSGAIRVSYLIIGFMIFSSIYPLFLRFSPSASMLVSPLQPRLLPRGENLELEADSGGNQGLTDSGIDRAEEIQ